MENQGGFEQNKPVDKKNEVTPAAMKDEANQGKAATEIAKNTQPDPTEAKQDLDNAMNGVFLGGTLDPKDISTLQAAIKARNTVGATTQNGEPSSIPSESSENINAQTKADAENAIKEIQRKLPDAMRNSEKYSKEFQQTDPKGYAEFVAIGNALIGKFTPEELNRMKALVITGQSSEEIGKQFPQYAEATKTYNNALHDLGLTSKGYQQYNARIVADTGKSNKV